MGASPRQRRSSIDRARVKARDRRAVAATGLPNRQDVYQNEKRSGHEPYGAFPAHVVGSSHAVVRGVPSAFSITDEAYYVDQRDPSVQVLVRTGRPLIGPDGLAREGEEPQAWVRTWQGGRVFVETFGHDEQGQSNPAFLQLMRQGIRWAAGRAQ
jgi:type 1 glutamine amidotransferase